MVLFWTPTAASRNKPGPIIGYIGAFSVWWLGGPPDTHASCAAGPRPHYLAPHLQLAAVLPQGAVVANTSVPKVSKHLTSIKSALIRVLLQAQPNPSSIYDREIFILLCISDRRVLPSFFYDQLAALQTQLPRGSLVQNRESLDANAARKRERALERRPTLGSTKFSLQDGTIFPSLSDVLLFVTGNIPRAWDV
ncbi:hypothetical protein F5Y00DRAFT_261762 [Daldinia vernicosa]|uniref:uncharacterized protein n=1 Tax=Daldinia vernicosa TaxID=114800 RepID=UPI0020084801|nr:uncharacterized protein F5Y00DRAFT_261762 [Daldinia vernicosa]KAI0849292.1 hypothetical protein F5Y00DRAFT_261762 [Daldinia vernicosa]